MTSPAIKALVKAECPAFEPFSVDELNKLPDPEKLPYPLNHAFIEDALSNGKVVSEIDQQTNQDGRVTYTEFVENISKFIETVDPSYKELHRRLSQTYCKIAQNPHAYFVDISEKISKIKSNPEKFAKGHCKEFSPIPLENAKWYIDTIKKIEPSQISREQITLLKQFHEIIKFDSVEEGGNNDGLLQWTEIQGDTPNICDYRDIFKAIDETKKNSDQENKKTKQEGLINLLHQTNWAKYQQETADHTGNGGIVLSTLTRFFSRGSWSWNDYFQKERPVGHFEKRKQAIETLATLFREKNIQKFEDAFALMRMQGQSEALHVLKQECKLDEYVRAFEKNDANEISESLLNIAIQAREGEYKFWEFPLIPLPRLGEGSLAQRASHLENWTLKSPELSLSAGLLNHVGTKTPNAYDFFHQRNENGEIHFDQFLREGSIEKHKSRLSELFQKNTLTEEDKKEFEAMLAQSTLNGEQKKYLQQVFELQKGTYLSTKATDEFKKIVGPIEQPLLLLNNAPLGDIYIQTYPQALFSNYLGVAAGIKTYQFLPFVSSNRFARLVQGGIQGLGALSIGITFFAFSSPAESENPIPSFNENFDQIPDLAGPKSTDRDFL